METDEQFWREMSQLISSNLIIVDRPKGNPHPRYPRLVYPFDYGYIENTTAGDGDGIDVWMGLLRTKTLTGILCTFDMIKRDAEIKLLLGCTMADVDIIRKFNDKMHTIFIQNPMVDP